MTATTDAVTDPSDSPWLRGTFAPVADELDAPDLSVSGSLPAGLRGTFVRNGPNALFPPIVRYHLFDGDGMLHGLTFDGEGGAAYANRWIRSKGLEAEIEAGGALFGGISEFRLPPDDVFAKVGPMKNTANTHVVRHAGRILALMEACGPTEIAPDLSTVGEYDFGGALQGPMTAHPKVDPATGEMVFFGSSPFPPFLRVHSVAPDGTLTWSTEVELPGAVMMHDFVITETKVLVFDLPAVMDVQALIEGGTGFYWDADRGARIGVLERGAPGSSIRWIEVDPFWVFHFLNAHDVTGAGGDIDGIELVGCRSSQLNASFDGSEVPPEVRPMLHRWRIDLTSGAVADEQLDDRPTDFPRINDAFAGRAHRYGYGGHSLGFVDGDPPFDGVTKFDLRTGAATTHRYGPGQVCGEAVFAADPSSAAEDGGWLLNFVHDRAEDRSDVVVLDAGTLDEVARVHLPRRVPFGFHGSFFP